MSVDFPAPVGPRRTMRSGDSRACTGEDVGADVIAKLPSAILRSGGFVVRTRAARRSASDAMSSARSLRDVTTRAAAR